MAQLCHPAPPAWLPSSPAGVGELADAGGAVLLAAHRGHHLQQHLAVVPAVEIDLTEVAGADDGHHGHLGLDGSVEAPALNGSRPRPWGGSSGNIQMEVPRCLMRSTTWPMVPMARERLERSISTLPESQKMRPKKGATAGSSCPPPPAGLHGAGHGEDVVVALVIADVDRRAHRFDLVGHRHPDLGGRSAGRPHDTCGRRHRRCSGGAGAPDKATGRTGTRRRAAVPAAAHGQSLSIEHLGI